MFRRRQEKIARHKLKRAAKRRVLRNAPKLEHAFAFAAQAKLAEVDKADAMAALVDEMQAAEAEDRQVLTRERTWKPLTRIDGRWHPTYNGHALFIAAVGLLLIAGLVVALSHPLAGGVGTMMAVTTLWNPTAGSVFALVGLFPVTRYGAKGDNSTDNATAFTTAITRAQAAGGGDVIVPKATGAYMVASGVLLLKSNVHVVGVGRPTIKLIGGASVSDMFRTQNGLANWGIRGCILDGNQANVTSTTGNTGLISIGLDNANIRIVDNELANCAKYAVTSAVVIVGGVGTSNVWMLNNYIHDAIGVGNPNAVYMAAWKNSWIIGNRVVNSYDDGLALISEWKDANDVCVNNVIAFNTCDTSQIASCIVVNGYGHRVMFNTAKNNVVTSGAVEAAAIRIRATDGEVTSKHMPYDIVCSYNQIATVDSPTLGGPGILAECVRSEITHNQILMPATTTQVNQVGIYIFTQPVLQTFPSPSGELVVDSNQIRGGYRSIQYAPTTNGVTKVFVTRNKCYGANNHSIVLAPIDADHLEVSGNLTEGAGGDGINWTGTWTDGVASDNTARNCTGYGLNIPSGTQVRTRLRGNVAVNCTAGARNVLVAFVQDEVEKTAPSFQPQMPALVAPGDPRTAVASVATSIANRVNGVRVLVPRTGTLVDLYVWIGTASGNVRGMVYSATADPRGLLFDGGSVAAVAGWLKLGDPNIAVKAGDEFDFAVQPDNATVTMGRSQAVATGVVTLPTNFWPSGTARPSLSWFNAAGSFAAPATIAQSAMSDQSSAFYLMARVA